MSEVYLLDQDVIISEAYGSVEEMILEIGSQYNFIDVQIDGEKKRLIKDVDYV